MPFFFFSYPFSSFCSSVMVNIAWERLDLLFMAVAPVALEAEPCSKQRTMSNPDVTATSCKPAIWKTIFDVQLKQKLCAGWHTQWGHQIPSYLTINYLKINMTVSMPTTGLNTCTLIPPSWVSLMAILDSSSEQGFKRSWISSLWIYKKYNL